MNAFNRPVEYSQREIFLWQLECRVLGWSRISQSFVLWILSLKARQFLNSKYPLLFVQFALTKMRRYMKSISVWIEKIIYFLQRLYFFLNTLKRKFHPKNNVKSLRWYGLIHLYNVTTRITSLNEFFLKSFHLYAVLFVSDLKFYSLSSMLRNRTESITGLNSDRKRLNDVPEIRETSRARKLAVLGNSSSIVMAKHYWYRCASQNKKTHYYY